MLYKKQTNLYTHTGEVSQKLYYELGKCRVSIIRMSYEVNNCQPDAQ